jgi:hypothetical protein
VSNRASFADFFALAPSLIALDKELDAEGCPVAYRKYLASDWLMRRNWENNLIGQANTMISERDLDTEAVCSVWYNNVYGHSVYQPPASRFMALSTPVPVAITWSPVDDEVSLPDVTLIQYELEEPIKNILQPNGVILRGLRQFQELPAAKWTWLAMADYDVSVSSFELARPAYHLSLWHSLQTLEKILKAVLISSGETADTVRKYNHSIERLISALSECGVCLTSNGSQLAKEIAQLVGGPGVRYEDDMGDGRNRQELAERSLLAHHLLLKFFASDAAIISKSLSADRADFIDGLTPGQSDRDLRQMVHAEHKLRCSHHAYTMPPYAERERWDILHPLTGSNLEGES